MVMTGSTLVMSTQETFVPQIEQNSEITDVNSTLDLVIGAEALLRIRKKVCELYVDKKVIISPCLSKLYISREQQVIDSDGKTSPDWFYFGSGVVAIIYDENCESLKLALFEETSIRLLWCMKWVNYVTVQNQTSNFHILNTKSDFSEHVGLLYENKDVADLILNAIKLISQTLIKHDGTCTNEDTVTHKAISKNRLLRSISLNARKLRVSKSFDIDDKNNDQSKITKRRSSLRDSIFRKSVAKKTESPLAVRKSKFKEKRSNTIAGIVLDNNENINSNLSGYESSPETTRGQAKKDKSSIHQKHMRLSRADSFRNAVNNLSIDAQEPEEVEQCQNNIETDTNKSESTSRVFERKSIRDSSESKDGLMRSIFRKRRLSRSQSLKIINRKRDSQVSQISQISQTEPEDKQTDSKHYQRATKLIKPRSSTDSLLLRGEIMNRIIETGHVARYARERKQWAKKLETNDLQSTDLCVTEL